MKLSAIVLWSILTIATAVGADDSAKVDLKAATIALLCADQVDNRIRLIDPLVPERDKSTLWSYPPNDGTPFQYKPTDAKRVEIDGEIHLLASYHGRVLLIRLRDRAVIKDFSSYGGCHSAELLPDGAIVTASSNEGKLRVHRTEDDFADLDLPDAHGVTWDKKRQCLWALGDCLYRLNYAEGKLGTEKKFVLPLSASGHDLFPLRDEDKLLVSNNDALFLFEIASEKFEIISSLNGIKSASEHEDGTIWVTDPEKLKGGAEWQSDAVKRIRPAAPALRYQNEGSRFYKARWWQEVKFSY